MANTVVGLFDDINEAEAAVRDLTDRGIDRSQISLVANDTTGEYSKLLSVNRDGDGEIAKNAAAGAATGAGTGAVIGGVGGLLLGLGALAIPGVGPIIAAGPIAAALTGAGIGAAAGGVIGGLTNAGVPDEEAGYYAEGVRRGGTLLIVKAADDDMVDEIVDVMQDNDAVDINERVEQWRRSGWSSYDASAKPYTTDEVMRERQSFTSTTPNVQGEMRIPVVEEELKVGKREVERGGVRVNSRVTETPVEKDVNLREEHVRVERRPVNRPLTEADANVFQEETIELSERAEEPVVAKDTRVVEEVLLSKDVTEHTETIQDSIRRTDVEVEPLEKHQTIATRGLENYDQDFRMNYRSTFGNRSNYDYEQYAPAYQLGATLAQDSRYRNQDWSRVESDARTQWEQRNSGAWEEFKDAVHYGWEKLKGNA